jgi:hypothetical protein
MDLQVLTVVFWQWDYTRMPVALFFPYWCSKSLYNEKSVTFKITKVKGIGFLGHLNPQVYTQPGHHSETPSQRIKK